MMYRVITFFALSAVGADALRVGVDMFNRGPAPDNLIGRMYNNFVKFDKNWIYSIIEDD